MQENEPQHKYTTYKNDFIQVDNYDPNGDPKGIRYKLTEQSIRKKLIQEMEIEQNSENDYFDEPTSYVSETIDRFIKPGFVHQPPKPSTVKFNQKFLKNIQK